MRTLTGPEVSTRAAYLRYAHGKYITTCSIDCNYRRDNWLRWSVIAARRRIGLELNQTAKSHCE